MKMEVIKPGLETTVQDYPGRQGMLRHGVPPSGPQDDWSFRLANLLVGNPAGTAALECQFLGPELHFHDDAIVALGGADMAAKLDGHSIAMWRSVLVRKGQLLSLSGATHGARTYIAVAGGISVETIMSAKATYVTAALGGADGKPLAAGQFLTTGAPPANARPDREVADFARPPIPSGKVQQIFAMLGPNDDWISETGKKLFFDADWQLTARSNRVGYRIQGPQIEYSQIAKDKDPDNGNHPSNIIDIGYPIGGINWAGETPIILMHDCITLGGFFIPFTVPSCELWRLAQARPGATLRFSEISLEEAQANRRRIDAYCKEASILDNGAQ